MLKIWFKRRSKKEQTLEARRKRRQYAQGALPLPSGLQRPEVWFLTALLAVFLAATWVIAFGPWGLWLRGQHDASKWSQWLQSTTQWPWQQVFFTLVMTAGTLLYVRLDAPRPAKPVRRLYVLAALLIVVHLAVLRAALELKALPSIATHALWPHYLAGALPLALSPMVTSLLVGPRTAALVGFWVSGLAVLMGQGSAPLFLTYWLTTLVAVYYTKNVRHSWNIFKASLISGLVLLLCQRVQGTLGGSVMPQVWVPLGIGLGVHVAVGFVVIALRPVLESLFRITTDFTLLELTDFNHPLLRRMQLEAPGTYHHSLMVATLAEKAAADIGANPWLCRTAALFHDVGKLIKPEYFVENQRSGSNPHIDTHPNISALVIKSHIKEGVALAQEAGLPRAITDMICQHHGTTLIQYFYTKAIEQNHATDESLYRYDGPKPQTQESAILFLADAIEATSRTLNKVTPQTIHELVHAIFEDRLADQQLDESPLTLADLCKLKKSFILSLHTMLHARVAYPSLADPLGSAATTQPKA